MTTTGTTASDPRPATAWRDYFGRRLRHATDCVPLARSTILAQAASAATRVKRVPVLPAMLPLRLRFQPMTAPPLTDESRSHAPRRVDENDDGIVATQAVLDALFGPREERQFPVHYWNGHVEPSGTPDTPSFALHIERRGALRRMLLPPTELSIVEAYISGDLDVVGNLETAMQLGDKLGARLQKPVALAALLPMILALPTDKRAAVSGTRFSRVGAWLGGWHVRLSDKSAIQYHYDVGNDFYALWLDSRMLYSCAYFRTPATSLDDAQVAKMDHICRKLRLQSGERMLDIGCGWGALLMHAVKHYGVIGHGITLSAAQLEIGRKRLAAAGLSNRCRIDMLDYRDLPTTAEYDKVSSVGVMEHIKMDAQPAYFRAVHRALKPGGLFLNHCLVSVARARPISRRQRLLNRLWRRDAFIDKYVFPDARLVPAAHVIASAESIGFELRDVESLREHYTTTLRLWVQRLERRSREAVALVGDRTYRVWRIYMSAAAHGLNSGSINILQTLLLKPGLGGSSGLPLTRDDLYRDRSPGRPFKTAGDDLADT